MNSGLINQERMKKCNEYNLSKLSGFSIFKKEQHSNRKRKARMINNEIMDKKRYSKGILQAINHGRGRN